MSIRNQPNVSGSEANVLLQTIALRLDPTKAQEVQRRLEELTSEISDANAAQQKYVKGLEAAARLRELNKGQQAQTVLIKEQVNLERKIAATKSDINEMERERSILLASENEALAINANLQGKIRRETELVGARARTFGDVESQVRATTGAIGYVGGAAFEKQANVVAELFAVQEAIQLLNTQLPRLKEAFLANKAAIIGITAAAAAGFVALQIYNEAMKQEKKEREELEKRVQANIDSFKKLYEVIAVGTTTDVEKAIAAEKERIATANLTIQGFEQQRDALVPVMAILGKETFATSQEMETAGRLIQQYNEKFGTNIQSFKEAELTFKDINKTISEQGQITAEASTNINRLTENLDSAAVQANDAAQAELELAEIRKQASKDNIQRIKDEATANLAMQKKATEARTGGLSTEAIKKEVSDLNAQYENNLKLISELEREFTTYDESIGGFKISNEDYTAALAELNAANEQIKFQVADLTTYVYGLAKAYEENKKWADALIGGVQSLTESVGGKIGDAFKEGSKAAQKLYERLQDYFEAQAEFDEEMAKQLADQRRELSEMDIDHLRDMANRWADFYANQAKSDEDYYSRRQEIVNSISQEEKDGKDDRLKEQAEFNKAMIRLAQDHRLKIRDIQRNMNMGVEAAVEQRDVSAAIAAIRQGKEASRAENEQYELEKSRRIEDFEDRLKELDTQRQTKIKQYQKQLDDLKIAHEKERGQRLADFQRQMAQQEQEFQIKRQRQLEAWSRENTERQDQFNKEWADVSANGQRMASTVSSNMATMASTAIANAQVMAANVNAYFNQMKMASQGLNTSIAVSGVKSLFAAGGDLPFGQWGRAGEHGAEWVKYGVPAKFYGGGVQGDTYSFNVNGVGAGDAMYIESIFEQRVIPKLTRAIQSRRRRI